MLRVIIYFFPAVMDLIVGSFFFVATVRMAESGASAMAVSGIITVWGVTYMVTTPLVGRLVTTANCVPMMVGACGAMTVCAAGFVVFPSLVLLYAIVAVFGAVVGFFFPPFMVFMKAFESGRSRGIAYSAAIYTFSWSLGLAAGPFIAGYIWTGFGWQWCLALDMLLAILIGTGIFLLRQHARTKPIASEHHQGNGTQSTTGSPAMQNMVRQVWIGFGICLIALSAAKSVFPSSAAALSISKTVQGNALALICVGQAGVAFFLRNGRKWMYRPLPITLFSIVGASGLILFGFARTPALFLCASLLLGVYGGAFFIYAAFHALIHPSKAGRYVGINESIVGFTGIVGPFAAGFLADRTTLNTPYLVAAGLVSAAVVLQTVLHGRSRVGPSTPPALSEG